MVLQEWKWISRRNRFPLVPLFFMILVAVSILYNELRIQRIHHQRSDDDRRHPPLQHITTSTEDSKYTTTPPRNAKLLPNGAPVELDRFTTCNATVKYSGHEVGRWSEEMDSGFHRTGGGAGEECDVFAGKWVFDNTSYPLYHESDCPYMSDQLACHRHGRADLGYQYWRWQPHGCNMKRWNAAEMWEKLRGKRMMFVGDSLNRGQWISMVCLLQSVIPVDRRSMTPNAHLTVFRAEDYNATVEFLWAPLLVDSNSDDPVSHRLGDRIIRPDSALRHLSKWQDADILVFNSYLWWRQGAVKLLWSSEENGVCEELDGLGAMELAMKNWQDWVDSNVDPEKKRVFFVTMSPTHLWSREWNPESDGNCYNESNPINKATYWGSGSDLPTMRMVENVIRRVQSKVTVLNITQLSEYRKDGHPSIYRKFWEALSPEQLARPQSYSDCIHWCLPGVPDVWNEFLFHFL